MKTPLLARCLAATTALLLPFTALAPAGELGDMLAESGWDAMIGSWGDKGSNGENIKVTYSWKFEGTLIEVNAKMGERHSIALIGINPKNKEIFHAGADSNGGVTMGKWVDKDGDVALEITTVKADGEEQKMSIHHELQDKDTIVLSVTQGEENMSLTLVRLK